MIVNIALGIFGALAAPFLVGLITPYLMAGGSLLLRAIIYLFALGFNMGARPFYYVFGKPHQPTNT